MTPEFTLLNIVFPVLLGAQIILLIIAGISRKESLFLANVILSCVCVGWIRLGIPTGGYMLSGLTRELFSVIMSGLFRTVDAATFLVCANVKNNTPFRLRWRKIFGVYIIFSLVLEAIWLLPQLF